MPQIEDLGREILCRIPLGKQGRLPKGQTLLGVSLMGKRRACTLDTPLVRELGALSQTPE
ncbi:hypothetical protein [Brasilonema bromeliae]|uniref:Uncharacterized protein n=1 Tax=Brasilonema bromeliae SPC951 TaxID=385972 RepID=A0ABX1P2Q3_9CYAN|nr:hypothetical protein [Brasilonema bromeliae]NMG17960.1 hypothetical protein [Brasilonema bromeliae SPC951]